MSKFDNINNGLALLIPYVTECVVDSTSSSRCYLWLFMLRLMKCIEWNYSVYRYKYYVKSVIELITLVFISLEVAMHFLHFRSKNETPSVNL